VQRSYLSLSIAPQRSWVRQSSKVVHPLMTSISTSTVNLVSSSNHWPPMGKKMNHAHDVELQLEELSSAPARHISAQGANESNL